MITLIWNTLYSYLYISVFSLKICNIDENIILKNCLFIVFLVMVGLCMVSTETIMYICIVEIGFGNSNMFS